MLNLIDFSSFILRSYKYTWFLINRHLLKQNYSHVITLDISNLLKKSKDIMKQYGGGVCVFVYFLSLQRLLLTEQNNKCNVRDQASNVA